MKPASPESVEYGFFYSWWQQYTRTLSSPVSNESIHHAWAAWKAATTRADEFHSGAMGCMAVTDEEEHPPC